MGSPGSTHAELCEGSAEIALFAPQALGSCSPFIPRQGGGSGRECGLFPGPCCAPGGMEQLRRDARGPLGLWISPDKPQSLFPLLLSSWRCLSFAFPG